MKLAGKYQPRFERLGYRVNIETDKDGRAERCAEVPGAATVNQVDELTAKLFVILAPT